MQIKDFVMVLVVIGIIIFAASGFVYLFNEQYREETNQTINLETIQSGNRLNEVKNKTESMLNLFSEETITPGGFSILFEGIGSIFLLILSLLKLPFALIKDVSLYLGVPEPIMIGIVTLISIAFVFALISAILRKNL